MSKFGSDYIYYNHPPLWLKCLNPRLNPQELEMVAPAPLPSTNTIKRCIPLLPDIETKVEIS